MRTWTTVEGNVLKAQLVVFTGKTVALKRQKDGVIVTRWVKDLVVDDQLYLKKRPDFHVSSARMQASTRPPDMQGVRDATMQRWLNRPSPFKKKPKVKGARSLNGARGLKGARGL